jgi:hypothetical protein
MLTGPWQGSASAMAWSNQCRDPPNYTGTVRAAPGVVIDELGAAASLWDAAHGAEPQVGKVMSKAPRKQAAVAKGNLFGEFAVGVVGGKGGRPVAALREGGLQVLGRGVWHKLHRAPL